MTALEETTNTFEPDAFVIDPETRAAISARGWTPAGSYDPSPESFGVTVCNEGLCYYINATNEYRFVSFD